MNMRNSEWSAHGGQRGSLYESIHNFAVYQHYFYGYPFYFFSGLVLLIGKTLLGNDWLGQTRLVVGYYD